MTNKAKNIILVVLVILLSISSFTIYFLLTKNEEDKETLELTGTVLISGSNYLIIEHENEDYLISNIKGKYQKGDIIKVNYEENNLDKKSDPYKLIISDEELIKTVKNEPLKTPEKEETTNNTPSVSKPNNNSASSNTIKDPVTKPTPDTPTTLKDADTEVLNYITTVESDFNSSTIKDSLKNSFITIVDFLFYNGKIKGYTFNELSSSAKLKVLSLALYFDEKIEKYFPGYKENISKTTNKIYTSVKEKVVKTYLEITSSICSKNTEACLDAKKGFNELKTNFGLTWNLIKDIASDGLNNLKNWYEIWSGK